MQQNNPDSATIARRFAEAVIGRGDMNAADAVLAEAFVAYIPISKAPISGREGYKRLLAGFAAGFPDGMTFQLQDVFGAGDRAVFRFTATGRHDGTLFGVAATGQIVTMSETHVLRLRDGQIVEDYVSDNTADLPRLVGVMG